MRLSDDALFDDLLDPLKFKLIRQLEIGGLLSERRLASYIGVSHVTAHRLLNRLGDLRLVTQKRAGRSNLWSLNRKSYAYQQILPLLRAYESIKPPKVFLKELIAKRLPRAAVQEVYLFGSLADRAQEQPGSDIDVALILKPGKKSNDGWVKMDLSILVEEGYSLFGKRISPLVIENAKWKRMRKTPFGLSILAGERINL